MSPAVELVEWRTPPTAGHAYDDARATGMQSLVFAVPSVADAVSALVDAGATSTGRTAGVDGSIVVGAELLDHDGVRIELTEDATVAAATFTGVRLNCTDLATATAWYSELGWQAREPVAVITWGGEDVSAHERRLALATHPFELHLTAWPDADPRQRAHARGNDRGLFRMALAVDDVRAAYEESQGGGLVQIGEPTYVPLPGTPLGGLWVSFFRDPDGVMVELVERTTGSR